MEPPRKHHLSRSNTSHHEVEALRRMRSAVREVDAEFNRFKTKASALSACAFHPHYRLKRWWVGVGGTRVVYSPPTRQTAWSSNPHNVSLSNSLWIDTLYVAVIYRLDVFALIHAEAYGAAGYWPTIAIYIALFDCWQSTIIFESTFESTQNDLLHTLHGVVSWILIALMATTLPQVSPVWSYAQCTLFGSLKLAHAFLRILLYLETSFLSPSRKAKAASKPRLAAHAISLLFLLIPPALTGSEATSTDVAASFWLISYVVQRAGLYLLVREEFNSNDPLSRSILTNRPFMARRYNEGLMTQLGASVIGLMVTEVVALENVLLTYGTIVLGYLFLGGLNVLIYSVQPSMTTHHALFQSRFREHAYLELIALCGLSMLGLSVSFRAVLFIKDVWTLQHQHFVWLLVTSSFLATVILFAQELLHRGAFSLLGKGRVFLIKGLLPVLYYVTPAAFVWSNVQPSLIYVLLSSAVLIWIIIVVQFANGAFRRRIAKKSKIHLHGHFLAVIIARMWLKRTREHRLKRLTNGPAERPHESGGGEQPSLPPPTTTTTTIVDSLADPMLPEVVKLSLKSSFNEEAKEEELGRDVVAEAEVEERKEEEEEDGDEAKRIDGGNENSITKEEAINNNGVKTPQPTEGSEDGNESGDGEESGGDDEDKEDLETGNQSAPNHTSSISSSFSEEDGDTRPTPASSHSATPMPTGGESDEMEPNKTATTLPADGKPHDSGNHHHHHHRRSRRASLGKLPTVNLKKKKKRQSSHRSNAVPNDGTSPPTKGLPKRSLTPSDRRARLVQVRVLTKVLNDTMYETPHAFAVGDQFADREVQWADLFFDVLYIGIVYRLGDFLLYGLGWGTSEGESTDTSSYNASAASGSGAAAPGNPEVSVPEAVFIYVCLFLATFSTWQAKLSYSSKVGGSDIFHKLVDVFLGLCVLIMALNITSPKEFIDNARTSNLYGLVGGLLAFHMSLLLLWWEIHRFGTNGLVVRKMSMRNMRRQGLAVTPLLASFLSIALAAPVWVTCLIWSLCWIFPLGERFVTADSFNPELAAPFLQSYALHRLGDAALIVLGEGVLQIVRTPSGTGTDILYASFVLSFVAMSALKDFLFASEPLHHPRKHAIHLSRHGSLIAFTLRTFSYPAVIAFGVGLKKVTATASSAFDHSAYYWLVCGSAFVFTFLFGALFETHRWSGMHVIRGMVVASWFVIAGMNFFLPWTPLPEWLFVLLVLLWLGFALWFQYMSDDYGGARRLKPTRSSSRGGGVVPGGVSGASCSSAAGARLVRTLTQAAAASAASGSSYGSIPSPRRKEGSPVDSPKTDESPPAALQFRPETLQRMKNSRNVFAGILDTLGIDAILEERERERALHSPRARRHPSSSPSPRTPVPSVKEKANESEPSTAARAKATQQEEKRAQLDLV